MEDVALRRAAAVGAAIYAGLIFAASAIPANHMPVPTGFWRFDKLVHYTVYAGFAVLSGLAVSVREVAGALAYR